MATPAKHSAVDSIDEMFMTDARAYVAALKAGLAARQEFANACIAFLDANADNILLALRNVQEAATSYTCCVNDTADAAKNYVRWTVPTTTSDIIISDLIREMIG